MKITLFLFGIIYSVQSFAQYGYIYTVAGDGGLSGYMGDGHAATATSLWSMAEISFDKVGNYYVAENNNTIKKIAYSSTIVTTIAGNGVAGFSGDGSLATIAELDRPIVARTDSIGNVYISDEDNSRIRKIKVSTGVITTVAGTGSLGFSGDGGPATAAEFNYVYGMAIDNYGNLYVSDYDNFRIRKIDTFGIISTIAGTGVYGHTGDGGPATLATIGNVYGICTDNKNNIYICDGAEVRKINYSSGQIITIAGNGVSTSGGNEGPATNAGINPIAITTNTLGELYIAEMSNNDIRKVDTFGIIHNVAGTGIAGFSGDGGLATDAELSSVRGVAVDMCGNLYISDNGNSRIREVLMPPIFIVPTIALTGTSTASAGSTVTVNATVTNAGSSYTIYWYNNGLEFTTTTTPLVTYTKGAGTDTITAMIVPTGYGCYDSSTSAPHIVTDESLSVCVAGMNALSIYPNPATNQITISANNNVSNITIINIVGQTLYNVPVYQCANKQIDVTDFPTGVYFVVVTDDEGNKTVRKIIKE